MPEIEQSHIPFAAPLTGSVDLLVIAGEHSGDEHAAQMVTRALQKDPSLKVAAIGGRHLHDAGAQLLFDLVSHSVIGFFEVIKHLPEQLRIRNEVTRWIAEHCPKAVCFVDYPGLNLNIAQKLHDARLSRKSGGEIALLYYISPQVWAWKAKRRFKMAELLDGLAVIFPFEVDTFADTDLPTTFVGHPFLSEHHKLPVSYDRQAPMLMLPGSRSGAVGRIAPLLFDAFELESQRDDSCRAVCIYPSTTIKALLEAELSDRPLVRDKVELVSNAAPVAASAVLTSSGTMSLNCALAGLPGAVAYRVHPMTYFLGKRLVSVPFIGIANLLLQKAMYPEFIQGAATPEALAEELRACCADSVRRERAVEQSLALKTLLNKPDSGGAASWLLDSIAAS